MKRETFGLISGLILPFQISTAVESQDSTLANPTAESDPVLLATLNIEALEEETKSYIPKKVTIASKLPVTLKEIPQSVSVVTQQRIIDQNITTVDDALSTVTGITVINNDSTQSQYKSRGYSLNLTLDGIPSYNGLSGFEQYDLAVYDRVEVFRGATGLLTGTGDPGGTVNLVTKKPLKKLALNTSLSFGSWDNYRAVFDITGPLNYDGSLRGRFVTVGQDRHFYYDKTEQQKFLAYGIVEYDFTPKTTLGVSYIIQTNNTDANFFGLPVSTDGELLNIDRKTNPQPDWGELENDSKEVVLSLEHHFDNGWTATAKARYSKNDFYDFDTFAWTAVDTSTWTLDYATLTDQVYEYTRKAFDIYLGGPFKLFNREHQFLVGYNYDHYSWKRTRASSDSRYNGVSLFNPEESIIKIDLPHNQGFADKYVQSGIYTQTRLKILDKWTLLAGGRVSNYKNEDRDIAPSTTTAWAKYTEETGQVSPYAGLIYEIHPRVSLYASYSDIFVPQKAETASGQNIEPREGKQYEIGAKAAFLNDKLNVSIAAFKLNDTNRSYRDPNYPSDYIYIAAGEVESKGWELEVSGSPLPNWNLTAGFTHATNEYKKDASNEGLPISTAEPENIFKFWSTYNFASGTLAGLKLGLGINAVSEYNGSRGTQLDREQAGYTLLSASASYVVNKNLSLTLNAENLTDKKYYTTLGGTNTYNFYGDPRNYTLTLHYKY